ncbi:MAG: enoyl-CoA hydratase/isomerase family protein [Roseitalea sp.]|nr:enoyl-CoA hydratase/isomerase family protein [Roseitalea sp.]MBO6951954.1 enoyl-CoA hydratase/isomerase family protein [Rhizobiaceae bacterium]MBO6592200.1 enoyl-CoA hydratase/isomerase family protein [Roseitalea sp.]MBO6598455.1 enoyl-CoA hydratase/isomerase family protein [Roseitalea sp.]MBO6610901.1 enoyl-CoA hydratase/isomerase family protein [Roseitalea sp.]
MAVTLERDGDCAVVTIDNPPVNAASHAVRQGLMEAVATCDADPAVRTVILRCTGRTFVAGADIREFGQPPREPHLPDVVAAIEAAAKPWVAAIHGTALGGGLELAMACRARVIATDAKLGLPEVNLGLIPGAGGTVRLPRLVDAETALTMVAGGKPVGAAQAHRAGLVDEVAEGDLLAAARDMARSTTGDEPRTLERPVRHPADADAFAAQKAKLIAKARGQQSIEAAVHAVARALELPTDEALAAERDAFLELKASDQSAALRHIFMAERATLSDPRCKGRPRPFGTVGVIGGGTMGAGIAAACLLSGLTVILVERDGEAAQAAHERVSSILDQSARRGIVDETMRAAIGNRFSAHDGYGTLSRADLVIEAIFEEMDVKKAVFTKLDAVTRTDAILATNTSYLDVNAIASTVADPSRVIGLHFFSPAHIMKLLEIVVPDRVADDVVATAAAFAKRLGKTAVLSGVCDGFIANRIMSAYRREADYLIEDGALPADVDRAMRDFGFPMGVFEMQDLAGLDIAWAMRKRRAATRDPGERYVAIADRLCERGRFGRKTGAGWYRYEDAKPVADPEVTALIEAERARKGIEPASLPDEAIMDRIVSAMQKEAQKVLDEGIASRPGDIDVVMTSGYGFPRWRGGPMFMKARQDAGERA